MVVVVVVDFSVVTSTSLLLSELVVLVLVLVFEVSESFVVLFTTDTIFGNAVSSTVATASVLATVSVSKLYTP